MSLAQGDASCWSMFFSSLLEPHAFVTPSLLGCGPASCTLLRFGSGHYVMGVKLLYLQHSRCCMASVGWDLLGLMRVCSRFPAVRARFG